MTTLLSRPEWLEAHDNHVRRVEALTADHLARRSRNERHPVWDFLFDYYPVTPGQLKHWSPGVGVMLDDVRDSDVAPNGSLGHVKFLSISNRRAELDKDAFVAKRGESAKYIQNLLQRTASNPAQFDCFGLHEWAMVYRTEQPRHPEPLRLGSAGTNDVVDTHSVKCTHYDAFRFFTEKARPLNRFQPVRASQPECEQSGCLHANMDLYKWATKLAPIIPGELWLDSFELAKAVRQLDMEASPYDLRDWGFVPVPIETPEGKAEYVTRQRQLSERAGVIRSQIVQHISSVFD
ncbi:3-methyladenine DNA glycosylase [Corynebacterium sp. H113]|uniref:3-methyladenine DNA glycosylase n=1 Tax=Corynebacterium sp. H113 TaxID=3133419 RepID=UPI003096EB35